MVSKFLAVPLFVLLSMSLLGWYIQGYVDADAGMGKLSFGSGSLYGGVDTSGWYTRDSGSIQFANFTGHHVMYGNGTPVDDNGTLHNLNTAGTAGAWNNLVVWDNRTWNYTTLFPVLIGGSQYPVFNSTGGVSVNAYGHSVTESKMDEPWFLTSALGFAGIVTACIAVACVAGFKLFGNGMGDVSVKTLVYGTGFLSLFLLSSTYSVPYLLQIPVFGGVLVTVLSLMYVLGVFGSLNSEGGGD